MTTSIPSYPLQWPTGQTRVTARKEATFKVTLSAARDDLLFELDRLGGHNVVISSNAEAFSKREPKDPGVAIYFDRRISGTNQTRSFVVACDTYITVVWNLRAVGLTIAAMRSIARYGASSLLEQAFQGFAALPGAGAGKPWWEVLGVEMGASLDVARAAYLELVNIHHPDKPGGSTARMAEINKAYEQAKEART